MSADTRIKPSATGSNVDAPDAPDPALLEDLVTANRILSDQGVIDAYGHISARDPSRPA